MELMNAVTMVPGIIYAFQNVATKQNRASCISFIATCTCSMIYHTTMYISKNRKLQSHALALDVTAQNVCVAVTSLKELRPKRNACAVVSPFVDYYIVARMNQKYMLLRHVRMSVLTCWIVKDNPGATAWFALGVACFIASKTKEKLNICHSMFHVCCCKAINTLWLTSPGTS
jgi:hypothetical protein